MSHADGSLLLAVVSSRQFADKSLEVVATEDGNALQAHRIIPQSATAFVAGQSKAETSRTGEVTRDAVMVAIRVGKRPHWPTKILDQRAS